MSIKFNNKNKDSEPVVKESESKTVKKRVRIPCIVHETSDPTSEVAFNLPEGAIVEVSETEGEFSHVDYGWVLSFFLNDVE